jgi:hypothetical protein
MTDTVEFYLADFRFTDNSKDYIIKEWKWVDLTSLGNVDSLVFAMSSSDVGQYGMNTPAYFCIDDLTTTDGVGFGDISVTGNELKLWPNPANSFVNISGDFQKAEIIDANGRVVRVAENNGGKRMRIDISDLTSGIYFLRFQSAENIMVKKLIVR